MDLDSRADVDLFRRRYELLHLHGHVTRYRLTRSKTAGHYHAVVTLPKPAKIEVRILMACLLASDRLRELMNFLRWKEDHPLPILVFERLS